MAESITNDWTTGTKSGPVSIGTHDLYLSASGPDRQVNEPVAIIIPGLAASTKAFAAVRRLLRPLIRTYAYSRSGYPPSDSSPHAPTSTTIARELSLLLAAADIRPPWILVAHSWGAMLAREFVALCPRPALDIAGLVLIDANTETMFRVFDWRHPAIRAVVGRLSYLDVTGAASRRALTEIEWREYLADEATRQHRRQGARELAGYPASFEVLAARKQLVGEPGLLGERPVCIVIGGSKRDYEMLYEAGVKAGNGSEEEREAFRGMFPGWEERDWEMQVRQGRLSRNVRVIIAEGAGHQVHLVAPERVVEGVKWVLEEWKRADGSGEGRKDIYVGGTLKWRLSKGRL